jgi:hypothetical protein
MKIVGLVLLCSIGLSGIVNAQELGLRFGDTVGNTVAIDGVFAMSSGRIHADVSFGDGVGVEALYDFIYGQLGQEAFNYYIGAGAFTWLWKDFNLGISGELGIEYHFTGLPLALGLDWRPSLQIVDQTNFTLGRFGVNIRYVF